MRYALIAAVVLMLAVSGAAWAAEVQGKIKSVDTSEKSFMLEDGTKIWLGEGVAVDTLKEGDEVTASYDEKNGKNVATKVEVK
jgi:Cu/Ag efflux protein CusF